MRPVWPPTSTAAQKSRAPTVTVGEELAHVEHLGRRHAVLLQDLDEGVGLDLGQAREQLGVEGVGVVEPLGVVLEPIVDEQLRLVDGDAHPLPLGQEGDADGDPAVLARDRSHRVERLGVHVAGPLLHDALMREEDEAPLVEGGHHLHRADVDELTDAAADGGQRADGGRGTRGVVGPRAAALDGRAIGVAGDLEEAAARPVDQLAALVRRAYGPVRPNGDVTTWTQSGQRVRTSCSKASARSGLPLDELSTTSVPASGSSSTRCAGHRGPGRRRCRACRR